MSRNKDLPDSQALQQLVVATLEERKAHDVVALDVRALTSITDYMVIATGTSDRHVKSLAEYVAESLREVNVRAGGIEGADLGEWVLEDFGDVILHVMQRATREFYGLEKLWSIDAAVGARSTDR